MSKFKSALKSVGKVCMIPVTGFIWLFSRWKDAVKADMIYYDEPKFDSEAEKKEYEEWLEWLDRQW